MRRMALTFLTATVLAAGLCPQSASAQPPTAFQIVYDVEDPCFEFLAGPWALTKTGSFTGSFYFTIPGPGDGSAQGRWIVEGLPAGTYTIEFYADNGDYPADARYQVVHAGGVADLQINMNYIGSGWHSLGNYACNGTCVVNINDYWQGVGTKLSVDALRFTYVGTLPAPPASAFTPHIGICIDDAGSVSPTSPGNPIYTQLRCPFPMTFAVMPSVAYTAETAEEVHNMGSEVILHQPMGYIGAPNPGGSAIRDNMTLEEVRAMLATNLDNLPHVVGMNNHTGSLVTQQTDKMAVCMDELKSRGLYFYDSRTYTYSVAFDVATSVGLLTAERDLFIDDDSSVEGSKAKIRSLAARALFAPNVPHLAIGHVRVNTAAALSQIGPELEAMGVEVWPISRCIGQVVEADRVPSGAGFACMGDWASDVEDSYSKLLVNSHSMTVSNPAASPDDVAVFTPSLQFPGEYNIFGIWADDPLNSPEIRATVQTVDGPQTVSVDQTVGAGTWQFLGRFSCEAGSEATVTFDDALATTSGRVFRADAVRYVRVDDLTVPPSAVQGWLLY